MLLQEISACKQCIVFNSDQYKQIYYLLNEEETSMFQVIIEQDWPKYDREWANGCTLDVC